MRVHVCVCVCVCVTLIPKSAFSLSLPQCRTPTFATCQKLNIWNLMRTVVGARLAVLAWYIIIIIISRWLMRDGSILVSGRRAVRVRRYVWRYREISLSLSLGMVETPAWSRYVA